MSVILAFVVSFHAVSLPPKSAVRPLEQGSGMVRELVCHRGVCK